MAKAPSGFVSLKSLKQPSSQENALELIRRIYFTTTRQTIEHDFVHAIELLKGLDTEEQREKATVYMHGLAELRKEWNPKVKGQKANVKGHTPGRKAKGPGSRQ